MKKFVLFLLTCALLLSFVSCVRYHAKAEDVAYSVYERADGTVVTSQTPIVFSESFLAETAVQTWNTKPEEGDPEALPEERIILIDEQSEFDAAFVECPFEVDLETEMIVVYTFSFIYSRPTLIKNVSFSDGTLSLKLASKRAGWGVKDASMPYQRYVVVKLDKLDVKEIKVDYKIQ